MRGPGEKDSLPMYYEIKGLDFNRSAVPLLEMGARKKKECLKADWENRWLNNFQRHRVIGACLREGQGLVFLLRVSYSTINFILRSAKY